MPVDSQHDNQVGELAESEQCTAEYQAESSADVTQQSPCRIGRFSLDVRVLQIREIHLRSGNTLATLSRQCTALTGWEPKSAIAIIFGVIFFKVQYINFW